MAYFLDCCVIIGYYFFDGDNLGDSSYNFFSNNAEKHTSDSVWKKCFGSRDLDGVCKKIKDDISSEFLEAKSLIRRGYSTDDLISEAFSEGWRIKEIIIDIVEENPTNPTEYIQKLVREYERQCLFRFKKLSNQAFLQTHNCDGSYPNIRIILDPVINDMEDVDVICDAHHLCLSIGRLYLVTGDRAHILSNAQIITQNTSITKICSISRF